MEELLKMLGVEPELQTKILNGMKENQIYTSKEENIDIRYDKIKKQLRDSEKTIADLTEQAKGQESLQQTIAEYENRLKQTNIDYALKDALKGVKYSELLAKQIDMSKLEYKDGQVTGIEEQLKGLKETYADFFQIDEPAPTNPTGFTPVSGVVPSNPSENGMFNFGFTGVRAKNK